MNEREIRAYCFLNGFEIHYAECPYANISFRYRLGEELNNLEEDIPGTKEKIVTNFLKLLPTLKKMSQGNVKSCSVCGEPSSHDVCRACLLKG